MKSCCHFIPEAPATVLPFRESSQVCNGDGVSDGTSAESIVETRHVYS